MTYNKFNAFVYELIQFWSRFQPNIKLNPWIKRACTNCFDDWVEWRTQLLMVQLDEDAKKLVDDWEEEEEKFIQAQFYGLQDTGSNKDEPLGGAMGYSYELFDDQSS